MNSGPTIASEFTELLGAPPRVSAQWDPFSLHVVDETPLHAQASFGEYAVGVYLSGRHSIRRKIGNSVVEGWSDPGTINFTPPGIDAVWEATAPSRAVVVLIRPEFVSRVIEEHWDADSGKVEIVKQFLVRDPTVEAITLNLAREAANGSPSGRLYAQSACEFLAHHLIFRYSTLSQAPPRSIGGLSSRALKLVLSYIEDRLGQRIELRELAALAGISVRHFERAFRQSTGYPPHAYVLERRLDVGRHLLVDQPDLAIEQLALRSRRHFGSGPGARRPNIGKSGRARPHHARGRCDCSRQPT
jgi:AraC-like DNA-binding protein